MPDNLTRPHPFGTGTGWAVAGGLPPQDFLPATPPDPPLESSSTGNLAVAPVSPARRLAETEPVRVLLRPVLVAVLGLLTAYGIVSDAVGPAWLLLIDAVVAVAGWALIEVVRARVYSPRSADRKAERAARAAAAAGRDAWASTVTTETSAYRLGPLR